MAILAPPEHVSSSSGETTGIFFRPVSVAALSPLLHLVRYLGGVLRLSTTLGDTSGCFNESLLIPQRTGTILPDLVAFVAKFRPTMATGGRDG